MKVLVTGAFGGLGRHVSQKLIDSGFDITLFDIKTKKNMKIAKKFPDNCIHWGDISKKETYPDNLSEFDAVVHLAFIIPPKSEESWARRINVGGTINLLDQLQEVNPYCRFIFASSVTVVGVTQHLKPPITCDLPIIASDYYTSDKAICEFLVRESSLDWIILRFAESPHLEMDLRPSYLKQMYSIAWNNRVEFIHPLDIATACKNAITTSHSKDVYIIGGGPSCQSTFYEQITKIFDMFNLPPPKKEKFKQEPVWLDWYDTQRSQDILQFQHHTFEDWLGDLKTNLSWKVGVIRFFAPIAKYFI
ncbi:MAG: NAD-dependent epimerase/dehydratase family protein [Candidatus Helarchaeota archaeon]